MQINTRMDIEHINIITNLIHARLHFCKDGDEKHVAEYAKEASCLVAALDSFACEQLLIEQLVESVKRFEDARKLIGWKIK